MESRSKHAKLDRRVIRTRKSIMDAFNKLLVEKGVDKITVSAIAREADIDRKTFYLHYSSIDDLTSHKAEEYMERVLKALTERGKGKNVRERTHIIFSEVNAIITEELDVFEHIADNLSIERTIELLTQSMHSALENSGMKLANNLDGGDSSPVLNLRFNVAGALALYASWLKSDHSTPIEYVSQLAESSINYPFTQSLIDSGEKAMPLPQSA